MGSRVSHETPEESRRTYQQKRCEYNNKNKVNSPNILIKYQSQFFSSFCFHKQFYNVSHVTSQPDKDRSFKYGTIYNMSSLALTNEFILCFIPIYYVLLRNICIVYLYLQRVQITRIPHLIIII